MLENLPKTLLEAVRFFADDAKCIEFVSALRWENGTPVCPHCGSDKNGFLATRKIWKCKNKECRKQFSIKTGTIFEDSALGLDKWLAAIWLIANAKNGISSYELSRSLGITQKSAWFVLHRIRLAMEQGSFGKLSGVVEADESYIGGLPQNMHYKARKARGVNRANRTHKIGVLGMLERKGRVRAQVIQRTRKRDIIPLIQDNVEANANLITDQLSAYEDLHKEYIHQTINHSVAYVWGRVHTNSIENFWSLLKRTIKGTYVSIQAEHLQKYVEEQCFRYNNRETSDLGRFMELIKSVGGKGITYKELIGYQTAH